MTSYLGWAHDVVWGFSINTLRKLGANFARAKDISHPMVANASVLDVFNVMADHVFPFTNVAASYRKAYSEGVFMYNMIWHEWGQWKRDEQDFWQQRTSKVIKVSLSMHEVFPPPGQAGAEFGGNKRTLKQMLKRMRVLEDK